ncbi:hemin uptake protein HemP [Methylobacter sp.]|jgi:hemin uptake protein HemP|uniref:hemin uptake protein HemP n=1 Tax=unclassified Methylobacter TaxID=2635283 RepID=UPI003DA61DAB
MKDKNNNRNLHRQSVEIVEQETVPARRRVSSSELFGAQNEIVIDHHDDEYRLRITSNGKLILTK